MSKKLKYNTEVDVILDLASESVTMNSLRQSKYRAKARGDEEYSDMIQRGIERYNRLCKLRIAQDKFVLPEDYLTKEELEESVGWRGME